MRYQKPRLPSAWIALADWTILLLTFVALLLAKGAEAGTP